MQSDNRNPQLLNATDRCVMCGMCLPHCPTYQISRDEGESPRGRIALIQGLVNGRLALSPHMEQHLDHCLGCRACEAVCPSGVTYGDIIDGGRAMIHAQHKTAPAPRILFSLVPRPRRLRLFGRILRLLQRSGLQGLARGFGLTRALGLARLDALLPRLHLTFSVDITLVILDYALAILPARSSHLLVVVIGQIGGLSF